jgi:hypothetical protein
MKQRRDTRSHFHFQWSTFLTGEEHRPSEWCDTDHAFTEPKQRFEWEIYCSIRGLKLQPSSHWLCRLKWEMCSSEMIVWETVIFLKLTKPETKIYCFFLKGN